MPRRPTFPDRDLPGGVTEAVEYLRRGTREQYESEWVLIRQNSSKEFIHDLDEVPWAVSVLRSDTLDGTKYGTVAPATDYTLTYANSDGDKATIGRYITITNTVTDTDYYFKVRAM